MKQIAQLTIVTIVFALCAVTFTSRGTQAANYTGTNTNDSGAGSLRAAIAAANATSADDTITFSIPASDPNCVGGVCTITLTSGQLAVNSTATAGTLTITNSTGANNLLISGNNSSRVFFVNPGGNLTLNGVTITNGNSPTGSNSNLGGGILNQGGTVTLTNSMVSGNMAGSGGGISSISFGGTATLTLVNSTVSDNTTDQGAGGIFISNAFGGTSTATLTNSTASGNITSSGFGGVQNSGGTLNLTGVTITNNRSTNTSCSICAGGIFNSSAIATLNNTIVAGNTVASVSSPPDFFGSISPASSYNLIGSNQGMTGITNGTNGNQVGTSANPIDPRLALLADNGGATKTHALLSDSPAIDKGNSFGLTTDQRAFIRPVDLPNYSNAAGGDGADIGAFEVQGEVFSFRFGSFPTLLGENKSNRVDAGSVVSINFSLGGYRGLDIFAAPPASQQISCFDGTPIGPIQPIETSFPIPLYILTFDLYSLSWQTNPQWRGTCRRLILRLRDGTTQTRDFQFR